MATPDTFLGLCVDRVRRDEATGGVQVVTGFVLSTQQDGPTPEGCRWTVRYIDGFQESVGISQLAAGLHSHAHRSTLGACEAARLLSPAGPPGAPSTAPPRAGGAPKRKRPPRRAPGDPAPPRKRRVRPVVAPRPAPPDRRLYKGVYWVERVGKYICQYTKGGKNVALGTFDDKDHEAAARVYDTKMRELGRKEVNFPEPGRGETKAAPGPEQRKGPRKLVPSAATAPSSRTQRQRVLPPWLRGSTADKPPVTAEVVKHVEAQARALAEGAAGDLAALVASLAAPGGAAGGMPDMDRPPPSPAPEAGPGVDILASLAVADGHGSDDEEKEGGGEGGEEFEFDVGEGRGGAAAGDEGEEYEEEEEFEEEALDEEEEARHAAAARGGGGAYGGYGDGGGEGSAYEDALLTAGHLIGMEG